MIYNCKYFLYYSLRENWIILEQLTDLAKIMTPKVRMLEVAGWQFEPDGIQSPLTEVDFIGEVFAWIG